MINNKKETVAVGLSGGVDSSVTAALLKDKGYYVIGLSMIIYDDNIDTGIDNVSHCWEKHEEVFLQMTTASNRVIDEQDEIGDVKKSAEDSVGEEDSQTAEMSDDGAVLNF